MTTDDDHDPADVLDDDLLIDDQGDNPTELVADDHDGQAQDHRLTEVLKTRRKVLEHRTQLRHALHRNEITQYQAETEYRDILESYLIDLEPIFLGSDKSDVWERERIDSWTMTIETGDNRTPAPGFDRTGKQTHGAVANGLSDILELPNPLQVRGQQPTDSLTKPPEPVTHEFQIPFDVLDKAFRMANRALNDWGLELQLEPNDSDEWEI